MNVDGTGYKQVTNPRLKKTDRTKFHVGDYDPKLSPDGNRVACMRFHGGEKWRIVVADLTSGREKELTGAGGLDAMPEWSDDGKLILFRHIDRKKPREIGIWTMKPDGSDRKQVPAPRGQLHNHPIFFPGDKAGPNAKIIYVARKNPRIP
jgi:Tol biopolymer transport system component